MTHTIAQDKILLMRCSVDTGHYIAITSGPHERQNRNKRGELIDGGAISARSLWVPTVEHPSGGLTRSSIGTTALSQCASQSPW